LTEANVTSPKTSALNLLEPGALLGGALFQSLLTQSKAAMSLPIGTDVGPFELQ
jgi:hypothetical protein